MALRKPALTARVGIADTERVNAITRTDAEAVVPASSVISDLSMRLDVDFGGSRTELHISHNVAIVSRAVGLVLQANLKVRKSLLHQLWRVRV